MQLKINTSITLSTGSTSSAAIVELFMESFELSQQKFTAEVRVWESQADKDNAMDHCYLYNSTRITNMSYDIPQADMDQAATDGHFGVIGTNHPDAVKAEIANVLGILATDIEITSLV